MKIHEPVQFNSLIDFENKVNRKRYKTATICYKIME